ncbi:MAG: hypothetical protein AB9866_14840 [Syntrophobacteraceae bacterium]
MEEEGQKSSMSRRNFMTKAGIFVAGGVAGYGAGLALPVKPEVSAPPPLPWKWTRLDPLEAGRRAYRFYFEKKG